MNTDSSALINSLGSTRDFLATKQAKLPHRGDVPPMREPANHQLTTSTGQAIPGGSMPPPAGSSGMWPPSQQTDPEWPLTLQGLLDSWGQKSSPWDSLPYDLNADGVVNVLDLIRFLTRVPGGGSSSGQPTDSNKETGKPPSPLPSAPAPEPSQGPMLADTVDKTDPADPIKKPVPPPGVGHTITPEAADEEAQTPITLQGLLKSWGQTGPSPYDLNFDGVVNVLDLIQWFMEGPDSGDAPPTGTTKSSAAAPAAATPATPAPNLAARDQVKLRQLADTLVSNLSDAGFTHRPPSDIGENIDALKLNGPQKRFVLGQIASRYPQGLGVSLVG